MLGFKRHEVFWVAVIYLAGKFVDFYAVLGVRSDASQEEIWAAYNRKKEEAGTLSLSAFGSGTRERLLEAAIAVLGSENRRMSYDFNGVGGTVDFEVHSEDLSPPDTFGMAASAAPAPNPREWAGDEGGSVIQGSNRGETNAPAEPRPARMPHAAPDPQSPSPFSQAYEQMPQTARPVSQEPDFELRLTAKMDGGRAWEGQNFTRPRPYMRPAAEDAPEESPLSTFLSKATFVVGAVFALLLSIMWMLELPLIGGFLPADATVLLRRFLLAANEAHIVKLWILVFAGGYLLWCAELFSILCAAWALDASGGAASTTQQWRARKLRGRILGAEILLFLAIFISTAVSFGGIALISSPKSIWKLAVSFFSLLYFFLPLFLVTKFAGRSAWSAVAWQVFLLAGHMIFILLLERFLLGSASFADYFTGGLFKFGYASWWISFFLGCKVLNRMNAR